MAAPRVLFVSKPIVAPWHDGSKNLVRDVATHLERARPTVMTTPGAPALGPRVSAEAVYRDAGRFAPSVTANARVALRLATGDPHDLWHFVFAPNPLSSTVANVASRLRTTGGWRGRVVQTVASAPRSFDGAQRWIFGDAIVALSEHTRARLVGAGVSASVVRVIPPCARPPSQGHDRREVRQRLGLGDGPLVLYPGDYEVSRGASTVAASVAEVARRVPGVTFVYACRKKTAAAEDAQRRVEGELSARGATARVKHLGEVADMGELLAIADVVAFPVDDLYGKVDLPLVLLEAMALGLPIVVAHGGPLEALDFARFVDPGDGGALASHLVELLEDPEAARRLGDAGRHAYLTRYTPKAVAARYDALYDELTS